MQNHIKKHPLFRVKRNSGDDVYLYTDSEEKAYYMRRRLTYILQHNRIIEFEELGYCQKLDLGKILDL